MYQAMCQQFSTAKVLSTAEMLNWLLKYEKLYSGLDGISTFHHFAFVAEFTNVCLTFVLVAC
jgi:hypothetical protein